jgi:hypothetical protein
MGPPPWAALSPVMRGDATSRGCPTIVLSYSDSIRNGWIGRQLPRLFKEQGLAVLSIDPVPVFVHYALAELFLGSHLAQLQASGHTVTRPGTAVVGSICNTRTSTGRC